MTKRKILYDAKEISLSTIENGDRYFYEDRSSIAEVAINKSRFLNKKYTQKDIDNLNEKDLVSYLHLQELKKEWEKCYPELFL